MPILNLSTNVRLDGVDTSSILSVTSKTVANLLERPEAYMMILLEGSVPMSFAGTQQPTAYGELSTIGDLNPDVNQKLSAAIATILETKLSIPKSLVQRVLTLDGMGRPSIFCSTLGVLS